MTMTPTQDQGEEPPPRSRSLIPPAPVEQSFLDFHRDRTFRFFTQLGEVCLLTTRTFGSMFKRPLELRATIQQMESLGVRSMGIVTVSSLCIGMVMTVQFAFGFQRFGVLEYMPRSIMLSFLRELSPTLTAVIVGGRIGSGMAAGALLYASASCMTSRTSTTSPATAAAATMAGLMSSVRPVGLP